MPGRSLPLSPFVFFSKKRKTKHYKHQTQHIEPRAGDPTKHRAGDKIQPYPSQKCFRTAEINHTQNHPKNLQKKHPQARFLCRIAQVDDEGGCRLPSEVLLQQLSHPYYPHHLVILLDLPSHGAGLIPKWCPMHDLFSCECWVPWVWVRFGRSRR